MLRRILNHEATRGSMVSVLDQGIVSLSNFLTGVLVAHAVTAKEFGVYSLLYAGLMVLSGVQNALITGPLRVLGVQAHIRNAGGYFKSQLLLQFLLGSVLVVAAGLVISLGTTMDYEAVISFAFCLFFLQLQELARIINLTKLNLMRLLRLDVLTHGLRVALLIVAYAHGVLTPTSALWVIALSSAVAILGYFMQKEMLGVAALPLPTIAQENWGYGRWILLEAVVVTISTQAYLYYTALLVDTQSAGALNAVVSLLNMVNVLNIGVMGFAIQKARFKLLEYGYRVWRRWLLQVGFVLLVGTATIMTTLIVFAKPLLVHLYTPFFGDYAYLIPILAVSYVLAAINSVLNAAFLTARLPKVGFVGKAVSSVLTLLLAYPVINKWGVAGAATGLVATAVTWTVVYLAYIYKGALLPERVLATNVAGGT